MLIKYNETMLLFVISFIFLFFVEYAIVTLQIIIIFAVAICGIADGPVA